MTKISWSEVTVNPFPGCRKVSPGCQNCYAEKMARRLKAMGQSKYENVVGAKGWTGKVFRAPQIGRIPGKGKMVFVNSMGDMAYEGVPQSDFNVTMEWMRLQPQHTFQVLTKRPEALALKLRAYFTQYGLCEKPFLPNLWLGVTAENQEWADRRIPILLQIPAAVRFVSLEPLLGPIQFMPWFLNGPYAGDRTHKLDWVIVGPETGPSRRPCDPAWIKSIVEQRQAAGVPVHVKAFPMPDGKISHNPDEWPQWARVRDFPKASQP